MTPRNYIFSLVSSERIRQDKIHGDGSMARCAQDLKLAIITEELGEVARAIIECDAANLREELVQVAACAVAWLESMPMPDEYAARLRGE